MSSISRSAFGAGEGPLSIVIDPTDSFAYVASEEAGALVPVEDSPFAAGAQPHAIAID